MPDSNIKITAWKYGTIPGVAGIPQPFFWDNPISKWDSMAWDVVTTLSSVGITESVPNIVIASATIVISFTYQQSGQPTNVSAVVVTSG